MQDSGGQGKHDMGKWSLCECRLRLPFGLSRVKLEIKCTSKVKMCNRKVVLCPMPCKVLVFAATKVGGFLFGDFWFNV